MTEKEKMLAGKLYFAEDEELSGLATPGPQFMPRV